MPAENIIERSFSGGEIAPALYARVDQTKYTTGLRTMRNHIAMRHGGATQRPGTMYVGTTLNGGNAVRLIPFVFNETGLGQSYVLEFGNQYIAFYQNGGNVILSSKTISGITQASPGVITATAHGFNNGDIIVIQSVLGMTQLDNSYFIVANKTTNTFTLTDLLGNAINTTGYTAYISGGTANKILLVTTTYQQADLSTIQFDQCADVVTLVHPNYPIAELTRNSPLSWMLTVLSTSSSFGAPLGVGLVTLSGSAGSTTQEYVVTAVNALGEESALNDSRGGVGAGSAGSLAAPSSTTPISLSWTAVVGAISYNVYRALNYLVLSQYGFIGQTVTNAFTDNGITPDFSNQPPIGQTTSIAGPGGRGTVTAIFGSPNNYPSTVGFVQQRRVFGNTINNPIGFWASQPGDFYNFNTHLEGEDSDGIFATLFGQEVNSIQHIVEQKFMLILTTGSEVYVQGNGSGIVTPSAINASTQSQYGASPLRPLKVGDVLLFNQALGSFIRDFVFDFVIDGYRGNDITMFSSHLFEGYQITDWAYQKIPDSIIWAVRSDGVLLSCTYIREQQILAWARHDFTNGFVENVVSIPENGNYAVYVIIRRVINGVTVRYMERVSSRIWSDPINATYLDCFAEFDGRNTGSTTMILNTPIVIVAGVNDLIAIENSSILYTATIPPGTYSPTTLATAIQTTMNTNIPGFSWLVTFSGGVFSFSTTVQAWIAEWNLFGGGGGQRAINTGATLGWPIPNFYASTIVTPYTVTAPGSPPQIFVADGTAYQQFLILTSSASFFGSGQTAQIGDEIFIQDSLFVSSQGQQGSQIRCIIQSIINSTTVIVNPNRTVPIEFQDVATTNWSRAVKNISGLSYLQGQQVSVWADRFVVGSPLNNTVTKGSPYIVSSSGTLTLDKCYSVIYVGLPMTADLETLAIDTSFGDSIVDERKNISQVIAYLYNSRGFFGGTQNPDTDPDNIVNGVVQDSLYNLTENKAQANRQNYDMPPSLLTGAEFTSVDCNWSKEGRIFIRNVDPIPLSVLAVVPAGLTSAKVAWSQRV